jgi:hypothetical protein
MTETTTETERVIAWTRSIWSSDLKGHEKVTALAIAWCTEPGAQSCSPTFSEVVVLVHMGPKTTNDALVELVRRGWIEVEDGEDEYADTYTLTLP